jgi:hypothetical protein
LFDATLKRSQLARLERFRPRFLEALKNALGVHIRLGVEPLLNKWPDILKRIGASPPGPRRSYWVAMSVANFATLPGRRHTVNELIEILITFDCTLTSATNFFL